MHHFALASNLNWILTLGLLVFVIRNGPRNRTTTAFGLYMVNIAAWSFCLAQMVTATEISAGLFWGRALHIGAIIIPISFYHFALILTSGIDFPARRLFKIIGYILACFFLTFSFSPYFVSHTIQAVGVRFYPQPGPIYYAYAVYFAVYVILAFYVLIDGHRFASGHKRTQLEFIILAYVIAYGGGAQAFLPVFGFPISTLVLYGVPVCMCLLTYAVVVHGLMDIQVIIRQTVVYSVVTGVLTGIYLLIATQMVEVLQFFGNKAGFASSALAAITVTLLFTPIVNKVRLFIERRMFVTWLEDMSRGVVHEVKGPLATISLPAELTLLDLEDVEKGKRAIETVLPAIKDRMRSIISKTGEAAERIETLYELGGTRVSAWMPVDVSMLIKNAIGTACVALKKESIAVEIHIQNNLASVRGVAKQLEIVLANLLKNAVQAMEGKSDLPVQLRVTEDRKWVILSVKDTGPGMSAMERDQLFSPNYTTKGSRGMGLGLYLSEKIVREHGGIIEVISEVGKGTEFIVKLPKHP